MIYKRYAVICQQCNAYLKEFQTKHKAEIECTSHGNMYRHNVSLVDRGPKAKAAKESR